MPGPEWRLDLARDFLARPSEKASRLGFLLSGCPQNRIPSWWCDTCICVYFVRPGEG